MFIYSQEPLSSNEAKAKQLYITYLKSDEENAACVLNALATRGTSYTAVMKGIEECSKNDYVKSTCDIMDACRVSVVMLSRELFLKENEDMQNLFWYEVGYMSSKGVKIVLFFLDIPKNERNDYLTTTPVRQVQGTDNVDELIELLDSMRVEEKIFYSDPEVNKYASKRISYVKLTSLFNIYKKDIEKIYNTLCDMDEDVEDENEVLNELLAELRCGCTVMRFNHEEKLGVEVEPYYPEVHTIKRDYPIKQHYIKPSVINSSASPDIYATIRAEFILPIHSLLGVTFKPFLSIKRISRFKAEHIKDIILHNANHETENRDIAFYKAEKEQRIYFLFEVDTVDSHEEFNEYGDKLNHLWPA